MNTRKNENKQNNEFLLTKINLISGAAYTTCCNPIAETRCPLFCIIRNKIIFCLKKKMKHKRKEKKKTPVVPPMDCYSRVQSIRCLTKKNILF